jgi:hypothetical protein
MRWYIACVVSATCVFKALMRAKGRTLLATSVLFASSLVVSACIKGNPATDTGDPGFPFGPSTARVGPLSYTQDLKPILDADCLSCHSSRDARGNYSVSTFGDVMSGQRPGDAKSSLVVDCSPGGSMYGYFSGDRVARATEVFRWIVYYDAATSR